MWLVEVPGDNKLARCKHCKKSFNLSNMGRQALVSHGTGQKHQSIIKSISVFTKQKHIKVTQMFFKSLLYEDIKKSCCFVACFDESLNPVTQTCEMDIVIFLMSQKILWSHNIGTQSF